MGGAVVPRPGDTVPLLNSGTLALRLQAFMSPEQTESRKQVSGLSKDLGDPNSLDLAGGSGIYLKRPPRKFQSKESTLLDKTLAAN